MNVEVVQILASFYGKHSFKANKKMCGYLFQVLFWLRNNYYKIQEVGVVTNQQMPENVLLASVGSWENC